MFPGGAVPSSYATPTWNSAGTLPAGAAVVGGLGSIAGAALAPGLSTKDRAHTAARGVTDAGLSYAIPYYAAAKAVNALGQHFQGSGSPQVRGLGRALDYGTEPAGAKAFWRATRGRNPFEGQRGKDIAGNFALDIAGPVGTILRGIGGSAPKAFQKVMVDYGPFKPVAFMADALGLSHVPTEGTQFRKSIASGFQKIPGFETFSGGAKRNYELTEEQLKGFSQKDRDAAAVLAKAVAPFGSKFGKASDAYENQVMAMLLNQYGHPDELAAKLGPALDYLNG